MAKKKSSRQKQLIIGIACVTLALLLSLSILSYNATDYDGQVGFKENVENFMGRGGSIVSYYLINYTFGYAVLISALLLLLWGWQIIRQKPILWLKRFTAYSLMTMMLVSFGLAIIGEFAIGGSHTGMKYSGMIGGFFASFSAIYLGRIGTYIVFAAMLVSIIILWSNFKFGEFIAKVERILKNIWKLRRRLSRKISSYFKELARKRKLAQKVQEKKISSSVKKTSFGDKIKESIPEVKPSPRFTGEQETKPDPAPIQRPIQTRPKPAEQATVSGDDSIKINPRKMDASLLQKGEYDEPESQGPYVLPSLDLLNDPPEENKGESRDEILRQAEILESTLLDFGVKAKVSEVHPGPVLTLYEVLPEAGVKVAKILSLQDDLARTMQAKGIRILAPIPGKDTVGIEIPNHTPQMVLFKSVLADPAFKKAESKLSLALGKTTTGETFIADLKSMPHLLIAGATGAGKSVGINTIIASILYRATPQDVQFVMIDPKMLELSPFKKLRLHHLLTADFLDEDVITKPANAVMVLKSLVTEMEKRYEILAHTGVRNIDDYNKKTAKPEPQEGNEPLPDKLEYIVVIIDELADLMIVASNDVEEPIARLAQMARAVGIHLIVATQRPSVDVITGVIKANFPARIAYQVAQRTDSRTILDMNGAERLLGKGDMLFLPPGSAKPIRIQNAFATDKEIQNIVNDIADKPKFVKVSKLSQEQSGRGAAGGGGSGGGSDGRDTLFVDAARLVVVHQQGSISLLQRRLKIGYSRAARLIDELEDAGVVGPYDGSKARQVLVDDEDDLMDIL